MTRHVKDYLWALAMTSAAIYGYRQEHHAVSLFLAFGAGYMLSESLSEHAMHLYREMQRLTMVDVPDHSTQRHSGER